jgi:hypothetical protein
LKQKLAKHKTKTSNIDVILKEIDSENPLVLVEGNVHEIEEEHKNIEDFEDPQDISTKHFEEDLIVEHEHT